MPRRRDAVCELILVIGGGRASSAAFATATLSRERFSLQTPECTVETCTTSSSAIPRFYSYMYAKRGYDAAPVASPAS